eukprot:GHVT01013594.1.p1 GENE.GHVT01013594.1~~GHVT01013594.1.p1  ORF type:complete len:157 (+),score=43.26 GHVT01013594.1:1148-1618(+)
MRLAHRAMAESFNSSYVSLHVRVTNRAAYSLYGKSLGYKVHETETEYYADREDAFSMRKYFSPELEKAERRRRGPGSRPAGEAEEDASPLKSPEANFPPGGAAGDGAAQTTATPSSSLGSRSGPTAAGDEATSPGGDSPPCFEKAGGSSKSRRKRR